LNLAKVTIVKISPNYVVINYAVVWQHRSRRFAEEKNLLPQPRLEPRADRAKKTRVNEMRQQKAEKEHPVSSEYGTGLSPEPV
jgi:hypothetical protein